MAMTMAACEAAMPAGMKRSKNVIERSPAASLLIIPWMSGISMVKLTPSKKDAHIIDTMANTDKAG
jgi:hypothetical protein